jgi:hypothetical protein
MKLPLHSWDPEIFTILLAAQWCQSPPPVEEVYVDRETEKGKQVILLNINLCQHSTKCTTSIISDPATIKLKAIVLKSCRSDHGTKKRPVTTSTMATALVPVDNSMLATSATIIPTSRMTACHDLYSSCSNATSEL